MATKVFEVTAETLTPLYTGEVREEERKFSKEVEKIAFPIRKTKDGRVLVPFKGPVRAALEKILPQEGTQVCNTGNSGARPCGRCILCEMFGSLSKKGRLTFDFLESEAKGKEIIRVATHTRINRLNGSVSDSFKGEEVIEGVKFKARVTMHGFKDEYLNLFKKAISYLEKEGIGGWTNKGYGRMKFEIKEVK